MTNLRIVAVDVDQVWYSGQVWSVERAGVQVAPNPKKREGWGYFGKARARLWCWTHGHFGVPVAFGQSQR